MSKKPKIAEGAGSAAGTSSVTGGSAYRQQYLSAENFWYGIVVPDYHDALAEPSNLRRAWHCAISLVHMADWVFHTHKTKTAGVLHFHNSKGVSHSVSDETAFAKALKQGYSDFGLVQDTISRNTCHVRQSHKNKSDAYDERDNTDQNFISHASSRADSHKNGPSGACADPARLVKSVISGPWRRALITFYYRLAPNPMKVALFLEEAGLPYELKPVDTRKGEQHRPEFLAINPNGKVPVIVDHETGATVFDSSAILLYLAEKTGRFLPENTPAARGELLSWLMFIATGVGPFSGQAVHFKRDAPDPKEYALNRYLFEARRHYTVLEERLSARPYLVGNAYTIVDMSAWGWARSVPLILGDDAWSDFPHLKRLLDEISARPAAQRTALLKDRHTFKTEMDEEARRHLFRHLKTQVD